MAAISTFLAEHGCNITDNAQFDDAENGNFFMRVSFLSEAEKDILALTEAFVTVSNAFDMRAEFFDENAKRKLVIMVSRFGALPQSVWRNGRISGSRTGSKIWCSTAGPFVCCSALRQPANSRCKCDWLTS